MKIWVELNGTKGDLTQQTNRQARNIFIYLLKKQAAASNKEIGRLFGGLSYSAVAKVCQRFRKALADDAELSREVDSLRRKVSRVKG